jgi:hypothetical protein
MRRIIISVVELYISNVANDVRDVHTVIHENAKRLGDINCAARENYEQAKCWRCDTGAKVQATHDPILSIQDDIRSTRIGKNELH